MKIRVTVDLDDEDSDYRRSELGSVANGVYGVDKEGVYHLYYGSHSYLCEFKDVVVIDVGKK